MKIPVTQIESLHISAKHLSLRTQAILKNINITQFGKKSQCALYIDEKKIYCEVKSGTLSENNKLLLKIKNEFPKDQTTIPLLCRHIGAEVNAYILTEEFSDELLQKKARMLLGKLSAVTKTPKNEILKKLTSFKEGVDPRDDLRFISNRQLPVLIEKMEKELQEIEKANKE